MNRLLDEPGLIESWNQALRLHFSVTISHQLYIYFMIIMKLNIRLLACCLMVVWLLPAQAAEDSVLGSSLGGLLDYVRAHNPELSAMHYEAEAAMQRVQPAGNLP
jgi:hypothetical protein